VSVGLCEEMGFQPSSKLSTTNGWWWSEMWWKSVPDWFVCRSRPTFVSSRSVAPLADTMCC